jgi:hypothetical protein
MHNSLVDFDAERTLTKDYLEVIDTLITEEERIITRSLLERDQYAEHVGFIRGLLAAQHEFERLIRIYFPT